MATTTKYTGNGAAAQNGDGRTTAQGSSSRKSRRGFAAMNTERQREIASLGGRAAHAKGTAHQFTSEEAAAAGRIGGLRSRSGPSQPRDRQGEQSGETEPGREATEFAQENH